MRFAPLFAHAPLRRAFLTLITAGALAACSKDDDTADTTGKGRLDIRLTDAPGPYEQVNIDVRAVEIHVSDDSSASGWQSLSLLRSGVINLLDLAGGQDVLLASADFPPGRISQLRLVLGPNNSIKRVGDANIYPLTTPSAQQSGLKLKIDADLTRDVTYQVMLDFDAAKSIVERGNGMNGFSLKPVIRTITTAIAGGVRGRVEPATDFSTGAQLISAARDTLTTSIATSGDYLFRGVRGGTYTLRLIGAGARDGQFIQQSVTVTNDRIKDVGTLRF